MFFSAIGIFSSNLSNIIGTIISIGEDSLYIESYKKYLELENVIAVHRKDDLCITEKDVENNDICFNNVSFSYPGSSYLVLKNISIKIEPEKFYVIVGANGAGKTTFISLLTRLYDPDSGIISVGDTDIRKYNFQEYRNLFGVVFQNYKVYDYSIAKALYRNAPILILDEPSSALDAFAEDDLIQTFMQAAADKTVFYISYRLSVAKYAYKVIFINEGHIEGFDSHEKLLGKCPLYARMYEAQAKHYYNENGILSRR